MAWGPRSNVIKLTTQHVRVLNVAGTNTQARAWPATTSRTHPWQHRATLASSFCSCLLVCRPVKGGGFLVVLRHALAPAVQRPQVYLCDGVAFVRSLRRPSVHSRYTVKGRLRCLQTGAPARVPVRACPRVHARGRVLRGGTWADEGAIHTPGAKRRALGSKRTGQNATTLA